MDTLYTFWDNITHYKTESVHFLRLMNSANKRRFLRALSRVLAKQALQAFVALDPRPLSTKAPSALI